MKGQVTVYRVPVRWAAPQATGLAKALGWLHGKAIAGDNGAVRYGGPGSIQAQRTFYTGYAFPPQLFTGYDPRKVAAGAIRNTPGAFPATSTPAGVLGSPVSRALEAVTAAQHANLLLDYGGNTRGRG